MPRTRPRRAVARRVQDTDRLLGAGMALEYERFVPRQRTILFDDRLEASAPALIRIVQEFFSGPRGIQQAEFGERYCWMGFKVWLLGDEEHGSVRVTSTLGVQNPDLPGYHPLDYPFIDVGRVSIRALSPIASRVIVQINYTPETLSPIFEEFVQYLLWMVKGQAGQEKTGGGRVPTSHAEAVIQINLPAVPQLEAPKPPTEPTRAVDPPVAAEKMVNKPKQTTKRKKNQPKRKNEPKDKRLQKKPRSAQPASAKEALEKIELPKTPKALNRWSDIYRIICEKQEAYLELDEDAVKTQRNATIDDLRLAINEEYKHLYSYKTIERIIEAGRAGYLKDDRDDE